MEGSGREPLSNAGQLGSRRRWRTGGGPRVGEALGGPEPGARRGGGEASRPGRVSSQGAGQLEAASVQDLSPVCCSERWDLVGIMTQGYPSGNTDLMSVRTTLSINLHQIKILSYIVVGFILRLFWHNSY